MRHAALNCLVELQLAVGKDSLSPHLANLTTAQVGSIKIALWCLAGFLRSAICCELVCARVLAWVPACVVVNVWYVHTHAHVL